MIKFYPEEVWKDLDFEEGALRLRYAVSNFGRVISYTTSMKKGTLLKGGKIKNYPVLPLRPNGVRKTYYLHKVVAQLFLERPNEDYNYVIHLDYNKKNNNVRNLQWVNKEQLEEHQRKSPYVLASREMMKKKPIQIGMKLTSTDVIRLKKKIFDPNRKTRLRLIAEEFGISEMQLYRIKSGENWGHIRVPEQELVVS